MGKILRGSGRRNCQVRLALFFRIPKASFVLLQLRTRLPSVWKNINTPPQKISQRISDSLAMVGLKNSEKLIINNLSGGEKQKVALAAVLAMEPDTIILDEPTANLDPASTCEVFLLLEKLVKEQGKTLIVIEHKLDGFLDKTDYIVVMDQNGVVRLEGGLNSVLPRLLFDPDFDSLKVFLPEHLLIIRNIYSKLSECQAIRDLRKEELAEVGGDNLNHHGYGLDFGVKTLKRTATALGIEQLPVLGHSRRTAKPLLVLESVGFSYQKAGAGKLFGGGLKKSASRDILDDIDLTINEGDFAAILGPNGAGKSTLLNLIFQIETSYRGKITLGGKDIRTLKRQKLYQHLGLVFQNPEWQFVTNDVEQELLYSLRNLELSDQQKNKKVQEMLRTFHLEDEKGQSPFLLSQGQKRRLSVAAMLLTGQKMLFLDEPTYGQDYQNQLELMELMKNLNQNGITIVLVTHDMSLVADYVDTVHLLLDGKIGFSGTPEQLFADDDLVEEGRLLRPVTWELSRKLAEHFPGFRPLISKEKIIKVFSEPA